jgi:hypothetical protein
VGWRLYADDERRRLRQVVGDVLAVLAAWWVIRSALRLRAGIRELRVVAEGLDSSGRSIARSAQNAEDAVDGLPAIGGALAAPFRTLGGAGRDLVAAGEEVAQTVDAVAFWIPFLLVLLVLGSVAALYLPRRLRWVREATEVTRVLASPEAARLLGLRAAAGRPLRTLRRAVGDPAAALAAERFDELAAAELHALGLAPRVVGRAVR